MSDATAPKVMGPMPVAPGLPLIGSLRPMVNDPLRFLVETYQQCGEVFRLRVLNRRFVVIAGTQANQFMTRNERDYLSSGPIFGGFGAELGGELFLASADGDVHKRLRKIQRPSYSANHIKSRTPEVVRGLRRRFGALQVGQRVDVQRLFQLLLAEQVGLLLHNQGDLGHILDDLIRVFRVALSVKVMRQWPPAVLHWPAYRRSHARIIAHARQVADQHRADGPGESSDLVDDILAAVGRGDTIRDENVALLTLGPLFGGVDTASATSSFALYNMLARPEVYRRVMAEVDEVFTDPEPSWEAFKGMTALRGVLMETLRMYPAAYLAMRHVERDFEFGGHRIDAGETLFVATSVPHFLPELFPEPYRFDIDRYGRDRREHAQPFAFAPYGAGVHSCLGSRLADAQMMVTLATLLHSLKLDLDPPDYKLRVKASPATMPDGLVVRVRGKDLPPDQEVDPWPSFSVDPPQGMLQRLMS